MKEVIDALLTRSGGDGASCGVGAGPAFGARELDELLEAWLIERGRSIESLLLLGRVRRFLRRITAAHQLSDDKDREARELLRSIEIFGQSGPRAKE